MDKAEIMAQAEAIGSYGTSILPDQDCCTLFVPRRPATRTTLPDIEEAEQALDTPALVRLALDGTERTACQFPQDPAGASREAALEA